VAYTRVIWTANGQISQKIHAVNMKKFWNISWADYAYQYLVFLCKMSNGTHFLQAGKAKTGPSYLRMKK
jgi:hypothetical protein